MNIKIKNSNNSSRNIGIGLLAVLAATSITLLVPALSNGGMYFLFLTAIIFSTLYGNWRLGAFVACLSLLINFFLLDYLGKSPHTLSDWIVLVAFGLASGFTVFICHAQITAEIGRRRAESRYRIIFEDAITGIYETTLDGRYTAANPKLAQIFGFESAALLIEQAQNLNQKFYVRPGRREEFMRLVETGGSISGFESEIYRRDNIKIWISENAVAVCDDSGKIIGFQGTTIEITDHKRAEAALEKAHEELERKVAERTADLENANKILRDEIAERERVEFALRQSEEKFRSLVEVSSELIWEINEQTIYTYLSPKIKEFVGYEAHEVVGQSPSFLMSPEEGRRAAIFFKQLGVDRKNFVSLELIYLDKNGKSVVSESSGVPLYDEKGDFRGYRGVVRDITERKQAEEAVRQSQEMLQLVINTIPEGVLWKDRDGAFIGCNRYVAQHAGLDSVEQIIGLKDYDLPWTKEESDFYRECDQRVMETGVAELGIIETLRQSNGEQRWLETNKVPLRDRAGAIVGVLGTFIDITAKKEAQAALTESELRLRTVVTAAPVILFALDRAGKFKLSEGKSLESLGLKAGEVVGKSVFELYAEFPTIISDIKRALGGESFTKTIEIGELCYESRYTPMFDEKGEVVGLIGVSIDVTESKRIESELLASQQQLRALSAHLQLVREEERKNIARELHDELGQTLTALKIDLVRLSEKSGGTVKRRSALETKNKILTMLTIVDQAMDTTRKIVAQLRPGILDELGLAAAMEWQTSEFQKRTGIECVIEIEFDETAACLNLKTTIFRILQECLTNIAKHAGAKRAWITLRDEGVRIFFEVRDDGRGIIEPEAFNSPSFGLLGIRERAILINGTVEIGRVSESGGTRITVVLPLPRLNNEAAYD